MALAENGDRNMNGLLKRGALIVFEGCDRSGKSTQCKLLVEHLKSLGHKAEGVTFPDRTTDCGKVIDAYLTKKIDLPHESIHLLFTSNRWELKNRMNDLLRNGTTVIVDRYSYSGVAFSTSKGLDFDWCKSPEAGLLRPDLVLFLQINPTALENRGGFGNERFETTEFQEKVHKIYEKLKDDSWIFVDALRSQEEILKEVTDYTLKTMKESQCKELNVLW